ncbi:MAG TPA: type II secretion system secretin GspD [Rhizomicrobium sp.]|jgi:general secretion pathway protein D|nr:type II secretion system secretin GspD [Rhizomicrobium sp.]
MRLTFGRKIVVGAALAAMLALAACAGPYDRPPETGPSAAELAAHASAPVADKDAAPPSATAATSTPIAEPPPPEIVRGTGHLVGHATPHVTESTIGEDGGITLNFINADVRDVAKAVFGDFLNVNYTIGAGVQGTITVQTSKPLSRSEVLPVFEQILRMNGLAIVKNGEIYKLVLSADAPREVTAPATASAGASSGGGEAGYSSQIVQLHYVAAAEMQRLLEGMAPAQAIVHADTGRNLLVIQGTQQERAAIVDEVALFDVDWLAGMSFGLFTPKYTDAKGLAKELNQILGGVGGPLAGIVKLIPIERLNAVLVISPQPRYLDQMQRWIARLDRPGVGSDRRIYVYAVQNGRASDLAATLKKVLYGGSGKDSGKPDTGAATDNGDTTDHATPPPATPLANGAPPPAAPAPSGNSSLIDDSDNSAPPPGAATITADENNNAVVIYGTPQEYATIESALRQLDAAPLQVLLEAAIAEVTLTNELQYGVQYFYQPNGANTLALSNSNSINIGQVFPGFSYMFSQGSNIRVVLNTLSQVTHVEVISSPEIMVLNNHMATLQVGDQVPIATSQAVGVIGSDSPIVNTIEYRATGIILKVTPRVNQGGMVTMDISQEVSDVSSTDTSTLDSPTITQRKIDSTIAVQDSETIALGGLIKDSKTRGSSGLPFLSQLPVVGGLFGTKDNKHDRTELIVLITPHVVDNLQKARAVTAELQHKLPALQTLLQSR